MRAFPRDLAKITGARWDNMVGGQYVTPPRPTDKLLRELLETAYLAAAVAEENRYPQFNIVAVPASDATNSALGEIWPFENRRPFSVDEIRRLAPAVNSKKSAIVTVWSTTRWEIAGLVDLGTSWSRARIGLQYHYHFPPCLFVQIDRPGRIRVYQGQYLVVALQDGQLERHKGFELPPLALHEPVHSGLRKIWRKITYPEIEEPREYENFQFIAFWNTLAALANCIADDSHGGAIIITHDKASLKELRIKYQQDSRTLRDAFVAFINARHRIADIIVRLEREEKSLEGEYAIAEIKLQEGHLRLVEAIRFVARLSGCDGAIVISDDLQLLGFGAEIRSELKPNCKVSEVLSEMPRKIRPMNVEQFGLRHRSAIKLVSKQSSARVLVVSQDGPISCIWSEEKNVVNVRRGVNLTNMNMPWA